MMDCSIDGNDMQIRVKVTIPNEDMKKKKNPGRNENRHGRKCPGQPCHTILTVPSTKYREPPPQHSQTSSHDNPGPSSTSTCQ